MILKIYEWDSYDESWEDPSLLSDLRNVAKNENLPPLIQVDSYKKTDHSFPYMEKEPKAIIDESGEPVIVYEPSEKSKLAWEEWCRKGTDHKWRNNTFYREIDEPIWGYDISTIEEVELILAEFGNIIQYASDEIRIRN